MRNFLVGLQLVGLVASAAISPCLNSVANDIKKLVDPSSVEVAARERWNLVDAPQPAVVVSPISEDEIKAVVKYCSQHKIPLLPQNGGNGWAAFPNTTSVVLNLSRLNTVTFSDDKQHAIIGGGAIISETVEAADAAGVLVMTGNCNCVGTLGAALGGGYGNLLGEFGMGVDQIESLRVVTADGEARTVTAESDPDLFWAMRGAGPNFGVVTSATFKAYPTEDRNAWLMTMTFPGSQIVEVAAAVDALPLLPNQVIFFILSGSANGPVVMLTGYLRGADEAAGRAAFAPLYALNPATNSSSVAGYTGWNAANDFFCARGDRKPAQHTSLKNMSAPDWTSVWDMFVDFSSQSTAGNSAVLVERYNMEKARTVGHGATAVQDALRFDSWGQAIVIPWYTDAGLDAQAADFASKSRDIWAAPASAKTNPVYINFAHGDEDLIAVYGSSLPRLQELKKKYDPENVFGQWFSLA